MPPFSNVSTCELPEPAAASAIVSSWATSQRRLLPLPAAASERRGLQGRYRRKKRARVHLGSVDKRHFSSGRADLPNRAWVPQVQGWAARKRQGFRPPAPWIAPSIPSKSAAPKRDAQSVTATSRRPGAVSCVGLPPCLASCPPATGQPGGGPVPSAQSIERKMRAPRRCLVAVLLPGSLCCTYIIHAIALLLGAAEVDGWTHCSVTAHR